MLEVPKRPVLDEDREPDLAHPRFRPTEDPGHGYAMAKITAQRMFSEAAAATGGTWDAITCCPADNIGPILSRHHCGVAGSYQQQIASMLEGEYSQSPVYRPWWPVDVRDTAACHVRLLESTYVRNGERYLAWPAQSRRVEDICADIDRLLPELEHDTPEVTDDLPERNQVREDLLRRLWDRTDLRNDRIRAATGMEFRALDDSIRDCVESLVATGGVEVKRRPG